ncbi:MAG: prolipoprotein diacylglyceryl transferase [Clostridia bacterium]|nr:prolipoprotein diacylglyceryl transferase [Clostridia bacterium]
MDKIAITIFGIKLTVSRVAFSIPIGDKHWDVYWYGIIIALGFLLALIYGMRNAKRFSIDTDRMLDVVLVTVPVAILCARLYYVIFDGVKLESIGDFFGFGDSSGFAGLAIYGGVIGAFATGGIMCKLRKVRIFDMFDIAAIGFLIGQGIGRWGNFINQEAYGGFTNSSWWGMQSDITVYEMGEGLVHPCFLYESVWCIAGFFLLHHLSKKRKFSGQIILSYCAWYGFGRAFIELLRTDSLMIGGLKVSALLSFALCIGAVTALTVILRRLKENDTDVEYTQVFAQQFEDESVQIEEDETSESDLKEIEDDQNN